MFEVFSGVRLQTEKTVRPHLRSRRPLAFSGFSVGIGQEIRHGCPVYSQLDPSFRSSPWWSFSVHSLSPWCSSCSVVAFRLGAVMDMVSPLVLVRVVTIGFLSLFSISLVIRMERLLSFLMAH